MNSRRYEQTTQTISLLLIAIILVGAVLYLMRPVVMPIVLAFFIAALARPLQAGLQRWLPNALALLLTILVTGGVLIAFPIVFAVNVQTVIDKAPDYAPRVASLFTELERLLLTAGFDLAPFELSSLATSETLVKLATDTLQGLVSFGGTAALVIFLLIFVLAETNILQTKLSTALRPTQYTAVMSSIASMQARIQQYMGTKTLFAAANATIVWLLSTAFGIDFSLLWAFLTFFLYFIPTFGMMIATLPPVLIALLQFETPTIALITLAVLIVSFNVLGNLLEPRFLGRTLSLSPLVVFISLMFWGWFFGVVGVILSVPLTVVIGITCQHIERLRPIAVLLSDGSKPPPKKRRPRGERVI